MVTAVSPNAIVGPSILGLITSGIYDNPLVIYREYIQNSVDELSALHDVDSKVKITINTAQKKITICDNGPGLTYQECFERLIPIAASQKYLGKDRGFRGIGRLSGLAFADSVAFLTRTARSEPVTRVVWSGTGGTNQISSLPTTEQDMRTFVNVECLYDADYPDHFFKVELDGVSRLAAGVLMNREAVRSYIGEVCPVPLAEDFQFAEEIHALFPPSQSPYSIRVTLNDEDQPIQRQRPPTITLPSNKEDHFREFERVMVPSIDGEETAALGWIAHSSYLGAIPKNKGVRGIRARAGNIQVGDEHVFDHLFEEERFNRWCVGELHILDPRIIPNGRRDYFESSPHLRNLENRLSPIFRHLTARCRSASSNRNREKRLWSAIDDIEGMYGLAASGYLTANDAESFVEQALKRLERARPYLAPGLVTKELIERFAAVETKLCDFQPSDSHTALSGFDHIEADTYKRVFGVVADTLPSPRSAREVIDAVLKSASKRTSVLSGGP